jgi:TolA-binding protein
MDALYNALVNGQPSYKEDGTYVTHPPSSLQLQAARTLKQLAEINTQNQVVVMQLQQQINQQLYDIQQLNEIINELRNPKSVPVSDSTDSDASITTETSSDAESVRPSEGEVGTVGRSDGLDS